VATASPDLNLAIGCPHFGRWAMSNSAPNAAEMADCRQPTAAAVGLSGQSAGWGSADRLLNKSSNGWFTAKRPLDAPAAPCHPRAGLIEPNQAKTGGTHEDHRARRACHDAPL